MKNMSLKELAYQLNFYSNEKTQITGYQIDSRLVTPGNLFFALKGEKVDGHSFLAEVSARGAISAVVDQNYSGLDYGLTLLPVEDVVFSLQMLARSDLIACGARVIGVTGSVGKTTTKDFIAEILAAKYRVGKTLANYNTKLTLPLSILNREGGEEIFVLEMGISEPGDMKHLLSIVEPEVAVVTKVALAHAAYFPRGLEEIVEEKGTIFSSPKLRSKLYFHGLNQYASFVGGITFSLEDQAADYFLRPTEDGYLLDERGVRAYRFQLPFKETHILHNFLAAVSVAREIHLEWDEINSRIPYLKIPNMRFECFEKNGITFINDTYNANPESMQAALSSLPEPKEGGKRIAVLGSMLPLGCWSEEAHKEMGRFAQKYVDHLLVVGKEAFFLFETFKEVQKPAEYFTDLNSLAKKLEILMRPGDVVLVKGSRAMQMEIIFELLLYK